MNISSIFSKGISAVIIVALLASCGGSSKSKKGGNDHEDDHDVRFSTLISGQEYEMEIKKDNISYSECFDCTILDNLRTMEVYGPVGTDNYALKPVVVFVPGKADFSLVDFFRPFVEMGCVVAVPKCTNLKSEEEEDKSLNALRCGVTDLSDAVRWLNKRWEEFGIDTSAVILAGYGSGAEVVTTYAYSKGIYDRVELDGVLATIAISPKTDINFKNISRNEDMTAPCLIVHGAKDMVNSVENAKSMSRQLSNVSHLVIMEEEDENPTNRFSDTLRFYSEKLICDVLHIERKSAEECGSCVK